MDTKAVSKLARRGAIQRTRLRPRKREEFRASRAKEERVAELSAKAFTWIARGRAANVEIGRAFNEIKSILGHGHWKAHFAKTFSPRGITQRTAQNYMERAREADADLKKEKISFSQTANDPQALAIREANEKAKAEAAVGDAQSPAPKNGHVRLANVYRLPLCLTVEQQKATNELVRSPNWPRAEKEIVVRLNQLCVEYGVDNENISA